MICSCRIYFRFNYAFGGLDPVGYHITNVGLHATATLMFTYICARVVFRHVRLAGLAGLLFAVHPIHSEAVSIMFVIIDTIKASSS